VAERQHDPIAFDALRLELRPTRLDVGAGFPRQGPQRQTLTRQLFVRRVERAFFGGVDDHGEATVWILSMNP